MKKAIVYSSNIMLTILIWIVFAAYKDNAIVLPMPTVVFGSVVELLSDAETHFIIGMTLYRLFISLAIAGILGIFLGIIGGIYKCVSTFMKPIVTVLRTLPVVSIILIVLIWTGYEKAPYIISFLMIFPVVYQAVFEGIISIDKKFIEVLKLEHDGINFTIIKDLYLPLITPFLKTALLQSIGLGIKVIVMSEFIAQTKDSIGYMIYLERQNLQFDLVYAWTIILIVIVLVIEYMVVKSRNLNGNS
ncbi:ABC transporter permease subunit [Mycoplasmatota bacterium]|nr:ABC transporter permease subunit [Mycoplasmatota bacterium]